MKRSLHNCLGFVLLILLVEVGIAAPPPLGLPRSTPEAQEVSSTGLLDLVNSLDQQIDGIHSFMLVRHGHVVAEGWWTPFQSGSKHELYSLSKSFTSTAVGMAVAEGRLSIDDPVLKFFPDDAPTDPTANLKAMRVRDLLSMSAGHQDETATAADKISTKAFLAHPVPHKPGTHFKYNTPATFMLSAIVQKQTGMSLLEYLRPRLFEPLGIEQPTWDTNSQGICLGGYGLRVRTEDIARFGQLYLKKGNWHGKQLLPAAWVEMATARQASNGSNPVSDWDQGYGFQFWRSRHNAYRGDGAFGQYCVVLPDQDAVVAITSGLKDMQAVLNLLWDKLLPALEKNRLPANTANRKALEGKLAKLTLRMAEGSASSPMSAKLLGRTFSFPTNSLKLESVMLQADGANNGCVLVTQVGGVESRVLCGYREWKKGRAPFSPYPSEAVAATGAWTANDTYVVKLCATETPYVLTIKLKIDGDRLLYDSESNVAFGPSKSPQLVGQAN